MARIVPPITELTSFMRGDAWSGFSVTFVKTGHDFTGTTASVKLRSSPDGPLIATPTPSTSVPALGQFTVVTSSPGVVTATCPLGTIYGDVELLRTSPAFGPKTWFRFMVEVVGDVTHA